jgi:hypothetical protein
MTWSNILFLKLFSEEENILNVRGGQIDEISAAMFAKCRIALELLSASVRRCGAAVTS